MTTETSINNKTCNNNNNNNDDDNDNNIQNIIEQYHPRRGSESHTHTARVSRAGDDKRRARS